MDNKNSSRFPYFYRNFQNRGTERIKVETLFLILINDLLSLSYNSIDSFTDVNNICQSHSFNCRTITLGIEAKNDYYE